MIPSLATQVLVYGIRKRAHRDNIGSHNEAEHRLANLSGESLLAIQALAFGIRKRFCTTRIGSHAEYMIPSLTTTVLVCGNRRRPYTNIIGPPNESKPRVVNRSGD